MTTRLILVVAGFLTYLVQPDDIVWALVRDTSKPRVFERLLFAFAAALMGGAALIRTRALVHPDRKRTSDAETLGDLIFTIGLAFFAPISGFIILMAGETMIFYRLIRHKATRLQDSETSWTDALKKESGKWGLFVTTIVFVVVLNDRLAEILAGLSVFIWVLLNFLPFRRTSIPSGA